MQEMFTIGRIVNTHGIKGEMKVVPSTDDINRFKALKEVYVEHKQVEIKEIETVRFHKSFVLIKLKGIETMTEAEFYKNALLKIDRKDSLPLAEDEYYISDLYDIEVVTEEGRELGVITDIIYTGSNDVYVIRNKATEKELLIPAIKQVVKSVSLLENKMIVHLLEGLEDL